MVEIFNTAFEVSLRVLLVLESAKERHLTSDMIVVTDFISVYGKDFGLSDVNLHGDNNYKFGEFALRRELVREAIKFLVLDGYVNAHYDERGFHYCISGQGHDFSFGLTSNYAYKYRSCVRNTHEYLCNMTERDILNMINNRAVHPFREGETNV